MSLPLTRRIARAALLVGAAAAPLVGAGAASAVELPQAPDLGGLTSLDKAADLGQAVEGAKYTGTLDSASPIVKQAAGQSATAVKSANTAVSESTKGVDTASLPVSGLPKSDLPLDGVPLDSLPVGSLPAGGQLPVGELPLSGGLPVGG